MKTITLKVEPGICGFNCTIHSSSPDRKTARIEIRESECTMIQEFSNRVKELSFADMFTPLTQNKIFLSADQAKCHLACPVPTAVAKSAEAVLLLALPKDVSMTFE